MCLAISCGRQSQPVTESGNGTNRQAANSKSTPEALATAVDVLAADFQREPTVYKALTLTDLYLNGGRFADAEATIRRGLGLPGLEPSVARELIARLEKAGARSESAPANRPQDSPVIPKRVDDGSALAQVKPPASESKNYDSFLERALKEYKANASAQNWQIVFELLQRRHLTNEARQLIADLKVSEFTNANDYVAISRMLISAAQFEAAEIAAGKGVDLDPSSAKSLFALADAIYKRTEAEGAIARNAIAGTTGIPPNTERTLKELVQRSLEASASQPLASGARFDVREIIRRGDNRMLTTLQRDTKFREEIEQSWMAGQPGTRESPPTQQDDPAYRKLREASDVLRAELMRQRSLYSQELRMETPFGSRHPRWRPSAEITKAAGLLAEALTLNQQQISTNHGAERLLVSAFLDRHITAFSATPEIARVLIAKMTETPLSPVWCEDFSQRKKFLDDPLVWGVNASLFAEQLLSSYPLDGSKPLQVPGSRVFSASILRGHQAATPASQPVEIAEVSRFGPDEVVKGLSMFGSGAFEMAKGLQGNARFTHSVERFIKDFATGGAVPPLKDLASPVSVEEEAARNLIEHAAAHLLSRVVRTEKGFFLVIEAAYGEFLLINYTTPLQVEGFGDVIAELDPRKAQEWSAHLTFRVDKPVRMWSDGRWSEWTVWSRLGHRITQQPLASYDLRRGGNGNAPVWSVDWDGRKRFYRPSARQISDAVRQ